MNTAVLAYAHDGDHVESHTIDTIFGYSPVIAALLITVIGIGLRTFIGIAGKRKSEFNPMLLMTSFIIGFFASLQLVIASLQHIPIGIDELGMLGIISGEVATVMGIDAVVKSGGKRVAAKYDKIRHARTRTQAETDMAAWDVAAKYDKIRHARTRTQAETDMAAWDEAIGDTANINRHNNTDSTTSNTDSNFDPDSEREEKEGEEKK